MFEGRPRYRCWNPPRVPRYLLARPIQLEFDLPCLELVMMYIR